MKSWPVIFCKCSEEKLMGVENLAGDGRSGKRRKNVFSVLVEKGV